MTPAHQAVVLVHGGAAASMQDIDGCEAAAKVGFNALHAGGDALAGVVAAVTILEDDGRFNAGAGSVLGSDGQTIEMDAAVAGWPMVSRCSRPCDVASACFRLAPTSA